MSQKQIIHYFTNMALHYREPLWKKMAEDGELSVQFYFGRPAGNSLKEINFRTNFWLKYSDKINQLRNIHFFGRLIWQLGVLSTLLSIDIKKALFLGDMNILSTWLAAILLRLRGTKVVFWGHGFSGGETFLKKYVRILFNKLAHEHLVYGKHAMDLMKTYGFKQENLHIIYNSLDYDKQRHLREEVARDTVLSTLFDAIELPLLVFIGRLTKAKKLDLLIEVVSELNQEQHFCNLLVIGDGEMKEDLTKLADRLLKNKTFCFYGASYNEREIGFLLANADLCVSPGNVGLTAIHSLSFGTPVCTHDNFVNQMPEHEAITPGITGFYFRENDVEDLACNIKTWFNQNRSREEIRQQCFGVIDKFYNPYNQMKIFKEVLLS